MAATSSLTIAQAVSVKVCSEVERVVGPVMASLSSLPLEALPGDSSTASRSHPRRVSGGALVSSVASRSRPCRVPVESPETGGALQRVSKSGGAKLLCVVSSLESRSSRGPVESTGASALLSSAESESCAERDHRVQALSCSCPDRGQDASISARSLLSSTGTAEPCASKSKEGWAESVFGPSMICTLGDKARRPSSLSRIEPYMPVERSHAPELRSHLRP
mmetsp:Transcript_7526/g.17572  ORF Transcript_7526/g.17572 Transcript_7526/m.17572 type:complete len:221 (+) Transcript_7526:423-1085(+)